MRKRWTVALAASLVVTLTASVWATVHNSPVDLRPVFTRLLDGYRDGRLAEGTHEIHRTESGQRLVANVSVKAGRDGGKVLVMELGTSERGRFQPGKMRLEKVGREDVPERPEEPYGVGNCPGREQPCWISIGPTDPDELTIDDCYFWCCEPIDLGQPDH